MFSLSQIIDHKSRLFVFLLVSVMGFLMVPVITPHVFHGYHMIHISIHILGVTLSVFLALISFLAYRNFKSNKLLFAQTAFSIFFVAEVITLIDVTWPGYYLDVVSLSEIGHFLIISTLGLLAMGVFRND